MNEIRNVKVLYDNHAQERKFSKLYARVGDQFVKLENHDEIHQFLHQYLKQEGVSSIQELKGPKKIELKAMYQPKKAKNGLFVPASNLDHWIDQQEATYTIANAKLNRTSPFTGVKLTKKVVKRSITALVATLALTLVACSVKKADDSEVSTKSVRPTSEMNGPLADVDLDAESKLDSPTTWEEYMDPKYNENAVQKVISKKVMDELVTANIKKKVINDTEITYGLTADQAMAFYVYYNSTMLSNEELLAILGDYRFTGNIDASKDLVNLVNDSVMTTMFSWAIADKEEDMIIPVVEDEVVQEMIIKYKDLCLKYRTATTEKEKKNIKTEIEEELRKDFIADLDTTPIDLYDHPSAHVVLNTVSGVFNLNADPLEEKLNNMLVGTEAQVNVATDGGKINGKAVDTKEETIIDSRGLVDTPCEVYIRRFDDFEDYRSEKKMVKDIMDQSNQQGESEYDLITKDSYEYDSHDEHEGVIVPIMNDYIVRSYGLETVDLDSMLEVLKQEVVSKIQDDKINNPGEFNPKTNPAGGKKGDTYSETQKSVVVDENNLSDAVKKEAEKEANKEVGAVTEEEGKNQAAEIQSILSEVSSQSRSIFQHYENGGPSAGEYNANWANSSYNEVRNYYNSLKQAGIDAYNAKHEEITNEGADNTPSHEDNPNQQPQTPPQEVAPPEEITPPENTPPVTEGNTGGSQDIIDEDYTGDVTTDDSDVFNPEDYGQVQQSEAVVYNEDYDLTALCQAAGILAEDSEVEETIEYTK